MSEMETSGCTCVYSFESLFSIHLFCFLRTDFVLTMETHFLSLWFPTVITICCTEHGFCSWNLHNIQIKDLFTFLKPISERFSKEMSITVQFFTVLRLNHCLILLNCFWHRRMEESNSEVHERLWLSFEVWINLATGFYLEC